MKKLLLIATMALVIGCSDSTSTSDNSKTISGIITDVKNQPTQAMVFISRKSNEPSSLNKLSNVAEGETYDNIDTTSTDSEGNYTFKEIPLSDVEETFISATCLGGAKSTPLGLKGFGTLTAVNVSCDSNIVVNINFTYNDSVKLNSSDSILINGVAITLNSNGTYNNNEYDRTFEMGDTIIHKAVDYLKFGVKIDTIVLGADGFECSIESCEYDVNYIKNVFTLIIPKFIGDSSNTIESTSSVIRGGRWGGYDTYEKIDDEGNSVYSIIDSTSTSYTYTFPIERDAGAYWNGLATYDGVKRFNVVVFYKNGNWINLYLENSNPSDGVLSIEGYSLSADKRPLYNGSPYQTNGAEYKNSVRISEYDQTPIDITDIDLTIKD